MVHIIITLQRLWQKDYEFKTTLGHIGSSRSAWTPEKMLPQKKKRGRDIIVYTFNSSTQEVEARGSL